VTEDRIRRALFARLLGPAAPEVGCEECFELLDEYVELEAAGGRPAEWTAGMEAHLQGCPACREEYESLWDLVARDRGG
jgi:predicted anti-sigma-YlaC factor YlaD